MGVRKHLIKLLRYFYEITDDIKCCTDICTKLVLRVFDEDDTVKDLLIKMLEELWFPSMASQPTLQMLRNATQGPDQHNQTRLLNKVSDIMGIVASFKDRQSPLKDMLHKIMSTKEDVDAGQLHTHYSEVYKTLIDGLIDVSGLLGFVRQFLLYFNLMHLIA